MMTDAVDRGASHTLRILEERALALARPPVEEVSSDHIELVVVRCGSETYALDMRRVKEVYPLERLTSVPGAPDSMAGLMNLRGTVHALLDLSTYLGLGEAAPSSARQVVFVGSAHETLGLLVDEVVGLDRVQADDLRPPLSGVAARPGLARGVTPTTMVSVIDVEVLLDDVLVHGERREENR